MEPLTSMTNTMFLRRGERLDGAKNWTKCPSETWRWHRSLEGHPTPTICLTCELIPINVRYLELSRVALSLHVVLDDKNAIDDRFCAVFTLFLLLKGGFESDMSLWTQRQREHNSLVNSQLSSVFQSHLVFGLCDFDKICELLPERVRCLDHGNAVGLKDVDVHLKTGQVSNRQRQHARLRGHVYLEVWHQPPRLKVQRVLVHS